jgi:hypothetical protein
MLVLFNACTIDVCTICVVAKLRGLSEYGPQYTINCEIVMALTVDEFICFWKHVN